MFNRPAQVMSASPAPEPLPENWLTDPHFDVSRLNLEQLDQKQAYHLGNIAKMEAFDAEKESDLLELTLDEHRLRGAHQHQHWVAKLCMLYGDEIGNKLANHDIEIGMTRDHLLYTYGLPEKNDITINSNQLIYRYGSEKCGSSFKMVNHVIIETNLITPPPYPPHAFDDYDEAA